MTETADAARRLIREHFWGVLSTHSKKYPGYPFGSVVPVCPDYNGMPLILISKLAQHTQNIQETPQVSLTLVENADSGRVQTEARVTLLADAHPLPAEAVDAAAERYYRYFPDSRGYHSELDFVFYRLHPITVRYIGGFGKIHWLSPELLTANPFTPEQERGIVEHMNDDHADALSLYWRHAGLPGGSETLSTAYAGDGSVDDATAKPGRVTLVAIDNESLVMRREQRLAAIPLLTPVFNPLEARQCLVAMVKAAREAG